MTASERTLKLLERAGRPAAGRGRDAGRGRRPRPAGAQSHRPAELRRRARHRAVAAHEDAQVARDRPAPAGARRGRPDRCEDRRGEVFHEAGAPRLLMHYPPFGPEKCRAAGATVAERLELTVAVDSRLRRPRALGRAAAARRHGPAAGRARRRPAPHRPDDGGRRARGRAGALAAAGGQVAGISCYPGHCRGDAATTCARARWRPTPCCARRATPSSPPASRCDRISGGSTPTRYLTHETCVNELRSGTYALLDRNDRPTTASSVRALGRGHRHLRRGARSDRGRRRLEDAHVRLARRRRPRRRSSAGPAPTCTRINEEHGYVDVSALTSGPRSATTCRSSRTTPAAA